MFGTRDLWIELVDVYGLDIARVDADGASVLTEDGRTLLGQREDATFGDIWRIRLVPEPGGAALAMAALVPLALLRLRRRT